MIPELGDYAFEVLLAYAVTVVLLAGIICLSLMSSARVNRTLAKLKSLLNDDD